MVSVNSVLIILSVLAISTLNIRAQDISSFFNQMMREYVPKNTRQYTMVNGVPVEEGDGASESGILERFAESPSIGPLVKTVLANGQEPSFLNAGPWSPSSAPSSKPSSSFFSFFGRSSPSDYEHEPDIITADDLEQRSDDGAVQEIKIQSSMSFQ